MKPNLHVIACGALAEELLALKALNGWQGMQLSCLPAHYHQTPQRIPDALRKRIHEIRAESDAPILVGYGDCGTGGLLDKVLEETGSERLPGAHCYEFFAGSSAFAALHDAEPGTFYLTDFLSRHFDTYVWRALGLDRHPEMMDMIFGNYRKLVYLAQTDNAELTAKAREGAERLGLQFERIFTAYGEMETELKQRLPVTVQFQGAA